MTSERISEPLAPAVSLAAARQNLRVDGTELDSLIEAWLGGIVDHAEHLTGRSFVSQGWRLTLPAFPNDERSPIHPQAIRLPSSPLIGITVFKYIDPTGAEQTLAAEAYAVEGEYLIPAYGTSWPGSRLQAAAVTIEGTFGYGADNTTVPNGVRLYILAKLVEQFDPAVRPEKDTVQASFIDRLLDRYKVY
jgi:uncharacterized phiE125 gp8 family phage protein